MTVRVIELSVDNRHLSVERGFMVVSEQGKEIARVPLDDIGAVIGCAHGLTYSNNLLVQLALRNVPFVVCGSNFTPVAYLWSLDGNYKQSGRMDAQIRATVPKSKQLWKQIIQAKIAQQAAVLEAVGENAIPLKALVKNVKSGDPKNIEAQAARRYWQILFGSTFRRDRDAAGVNTLLNYGYMIIRSCVARAIMGAGLHPSLGVHHTNENNPMRLVDDLMEPFRPFIDCIVWHMNKKGSCELTPDIKKHLVSVLKMEVSTQAGLTSIQNAIQETATSLALIYLGQKESLALPDPQPLLWFETA
ncbi:MAG: type II CRISPR-associated endonuclease Cas1 [Alphaproteobacteria bacterium]|nr:type II CRISPR-associated endonuclease Cas1 [Alphaproteobacteria bacterium]